MPTTGRNLDPRGRPVPGTGFELDPESELGRLLADRTGALTSHPDRDGWTAPLPAPGKEDTVQSVGVFESDFDGPPEHYHETATERFELLAGRAVFDIDGEKRPANAGDTVTVEPGERHSFTIGGESLCYMLVDIESPGHLPYVLPALGGLAYDEARNLGNPLQQVAVADRLAGNTSFTEPDPRLIRALRVALAPIAQLGGYRGAYDKYTQDAFWERHVEQPDV